MLSTVSCTELDWECIMYACMYVYVYRGPNKSSATLFYCKNLDNPQVKIMEFVELLQYLILNAVILSFIF